MLKSKIILINLPLVTSGFQVIVPSFHNQTKIFGNTQKLMIERSLYYEVYIAMDVVQAFYVFEWILS